MHIEKLMDSNDSDFWKKRKRLNEKGVVNSHKQKSIALAYKLVNSVRNKYCDSKSDAALMDDFIKKYDKNAMMYEQKVDKTFTELSIEDVELEAIDLKTNKACDRNGLVIEHVLFSHPVIYKFLKKLFNLSLKHSYVPANFKTSIMTSVVKDEQNKNIDDISNYRPITIISVLSKLFEACLYRKIKDKLSACGLQFGYVSEGGCEKSLHVLSTVVYHFLKERTDVYMVTLNTTAAFDKVNTYGLLSKLLDKSVPLDVVRTLLSWFWKKICLWQVE